MLESICVWRANPDGLDPGALAEALVFYKRVHVALSAAPFKELVRFAEPEPLLDLMQLGTLQIHLVEDLPAVLSASSRTSGLPGHDFALVTAEKTSWTSVQREFLRPLTRTSEERRKLAIQFDRYIKPTRHDPDFASRARTDLADPDYLLGCIGGIVKAKAPDYPVADLRFAMKFDGSLFLPSTNLDFGKLSKAVGREVKLDDLLVSLYDGRDALEFAAVNSADLSLKPIQYAVVHRKFRRLIDRSDRKQSDIQEFHKEVFPQGRSIAEAVNSGSRSFRDVVELVKSAERFKKWVTELQGDERILEEYIREVSSISWAEKLPAKVLRWALFTAIGEMAASHFGGVAGAAAGLADALFVDRIAKGWRPNEFVEGEVRKFLGAEEASNTR
jgi:uncharacterized membrane protein YtjA (UPF0391 family)